MSKDKKNDKRSLKCAPLDPAEEEEKEEKENDDEEEEEEEKGGGSYMKVT